MKRTRISRRAVLRGLAGGVGATVALPVLEAMLDSHGEALADGAALPVRFATFLFGNGVILPRWTPSATGAGWALTDELAPLAPVKEYCSILSGFHNKIPPITHHEGMAGMFSGHPYVQTGGLESKFGGPSIDQVVADAIAGSTPFKSIEIGVSKRVSKNEGNTMQFLSHRGPDEPLPPEYSPRALFRRLFDTPLPDDPSRARRIAVLDLVREDAKRLRTRLGANDRHRLDAHLEAVHRLQQQIDALGVACEPPEEPVEENVDVDGQEPMGSVAPLMADLLAHAWACDLTRVASFMLTGGVGYTVYAVLGQTQEQHFMSHMPNTYGAQLHATVVWNMEQLSYLLQRLQATPEGTGNLLDRSLILMGSDCAEGWTHGAFDMPVVIAGRAGGAVVSPGIHYRATGNRNLSDALLTALKAVVPTATSIGSDVGYSQSPVTQILV